MAAPIVYGPTISTYVRTVRLTLEEKPASYELVDVAMIQGAHKEPTHLARCPFGRIPAFSHDGFDLYETDAVVRYIDQVIPGQDLQPVEAQPEGEQVGKCDQATVQGELQKRVSVNGPSRGANPSAHRGRFY